MSKNWKTTQKDKLDRFYTKDEVAILCTKLFTTQYGSDFIFIEPSAGGGAFIRALDGNCTGYDLAPQCEGIVEANTLELALEMSENHVVIGNPPFGKNGSLTKAFIKWAVGCGAGTIAFILPKTYMKVSRQRDIPRDYKLVICEDLEDNAFLLNNQDYHVPSVFQVWSSCLDGVDLRNDGFVPENIWFEFCKPIDADAFIMGAAPTKVKLPTDVSKDNRGYWIKLKSGVDFSELCAKMSSIDWKAAALSSVSGGVAWFDKQTIARCLQ